MARTISYPFRVYLATGTSSGILMRIEPGRSLAGMYAVDGVDKKCPKTWLTSSI
jgi:hypothetical protein